MSGQHPQPVGPGCWVTGTDTEVGKTRIAAALLHAAVAQGLCAAGYKPVAAGVDAQGLNEDVEILRAASRPPLSARQVCPALLSEPCAPHVAAQHMGRALTLAPLVAGAQALAAQAPYLVVEGVGGFCVPLNEQHTSADLARALGLPVVLVVGLQLGCINHALLTAQAIASAGLRLAGWVGNHRDAAMLHRQDTIDTLSLWLGRDHGAPCLGIVPHLVSPSPQAVLRHLSVPVLQTRLFASIASAL
ncbi:dethiobiotin synthase [Ottowia testudinis]|uniref:ATP-dependent dethiobiotin synthetase BioD n=1 Tax=Ottowia testudinis TaxID=2816950 RepID=A0A975H442_9BURK|nr:dethiobiotin synthase [Ottowia testudinis]QTD45931.1 dethiobiotin synthase [Ottowia testudinis]